MSLLERDVLVRGPLEDPTVAAGLLATCMGLGEKPFSSSSSYSVSGLGTKSNTVDMTLKELFHLPPVSAVSVPFPTLIPKQNGTVINAVGAGMGGLTRERGGVAVSSAMQTCCLRAASVMQAMAKLPRLLRENNALTLFRNLEMPLLVR